MPGYVKAAQCNAKHEDSDEEADLVVKIAIKCLKGKDDGQIEHHSCQSGREDGIGDGLS